MAQSLFRELLLRLEPTFRHLRDQLKRLTGPPDGGYISGAYVDEAHCAVNIH